MTPTPQETMVSGKTELRRPPPGEEVVISGMSGIFPSSDSVLEFMENLYDKVDMVTTEDPRWTLDHPEIPKHVGKIKGMTKFDSQFFRVHYKQAMVMEPMSRKLLEHAYSAIYDSGTNPLQLQGKKVGVFIGCGISELEKNVIYENVQRNGLGVTGCNKSMYANRISYWIDGKGPSYTMDVACASSASCLEHAYRNISSGQCDAAIVGGCNLCNDPHVFLNCSRAGFLCLDGKTKCFDKTGDGHVRSDAITVMFLQKAKDAKRIYSEVYHAKSNCSVTYEPLSALRTPENIQEFLGDFYAEIGISPDDVEYVEANGSAIAEIDKNEMTAIGKVFANNKPIKIGCVKSNMGTSEPASGICAITKMCLAYHTGKIPGNLHYSTPIDIPGLENKIQVLTDNTNFDRGFTAYNCFSFGGVNVHILLKGYYKEKDYSRYKSSIPYLVLISGREEKGVAKTLENLKKNTFDPEQFALFHNIHRYDIPGHMCRGFSILDTNEKNETVSLSQSAEYCPGLTRPVWFAYSGMGSQWATMGAQLMRIPIFAAAIQKCHNVLEPKGLDIVKILCDPDKTTYDNILHSFVGIAAVQIGLTDILKAMGVVPDYIIGHSVGELGCAYADGCFTAEEMILAAYSRGLVSVQTPFIRGSMAAVGLGYEAVLPMCPPEIEVACHNSADSATISGPADIMKEFVSELTSKSIFAKEVPCSNIAYHSRYIADAGPGLLKYLSEVIKNPKERSKKWVSTSVPQEKWDELAAKYSSAEYHTNNLLNPVLFEETSKLIPSDALVIEIAPHGLLQAILKRSLPDCVHIPLTRRGTSDPVKFLLEAFGKIYQAEVNLQIDVLYPKIEFPVSTRTQFLSQNVQWEHTEEWPELKFVSKDVVVVPERDFVMSIYDDDYKYFKGHVRDGNCVFPESALLVLVWETFAMYNKVENYTDLSVVFENIQFHEEVIIKDEVPVKLKIMIFKGNNRFEVIHENYTIVSGVVTEFKKKEQILRHLGERETTFDDVLLSSEDIYTNMRLKGYDYKNEFQSIRTTTLSRNIANVRWTENWITLLDSLLQLNAFAKDSNGLSVPLLIKKLTIDTENHKNLQLVMVDNMPCLKASVYDVYDLTRCGGVDIDGLVFKVKPIVQQKPDVALTQVFVPHFSTGMISMKTALQVNLQIINENISVHDELQIIDLIASNKNEVTKTIKEVAKELLLSKLTVKSIKDNPSIRNSDVVMIDNMLADEKKMSEIYNILPKNTFILALEQDTTIIRPQYKLFNIITTMTVQRQILLLLRKVDEAADDNIIYMPIVHDQKFSWISRLQTELQKSRKVVLVSERQHYCGLLGLVRKLNQNHGNKIGLVLVDDYLAPSFCPEKDIFKKQLEKKLSLNILKKGHWGGYYYISNERFKQIENVCLVSTTPDLDALSWIDKPLLTETKDLVQVCYAGASIRDANIAVGQSNSIGTLLGMDFSGINDRGEKVMGIVEGGAIGNHVVADPDLLWPVPENWTLEDAATVPLAYFYAYYCLTIRSKLKRGMKVLVNDGAGELSQAVISICQYLNCEVFVGGCEAKQKEFLLMMFPDLKAENVNLTPMVANKGTTCDTKLCDAVINCLSGSMRKAAMKCVGMSGYFLDACGYDMMENDTFGLNYLVGERNYLGINFDAIFSSMSGKEKKEVQLSIAEGIAKGIVRPLSRVVYAPADVTRAFRLLSARKNKGKVLIGMNSLDSLNVTSRMSYSPEGCYIVVCDESAMSIELADRLVRGGATNLLLHEKPNRLDGYLRTKLLSWQKLGVSVNVSTQNLQTEEGCMILLREGAKLGPVRGIFIVPGVNSGRSSGIDSIGEKFKNTVTVVAYMDLASRKLCNELEHFVVLNSLSREPSDEYVATAIDNICRARSEACLPGLAFRAGQIKELDDSERVHWKVQPQPLTAVFSALESSLKHKETNVVTYNLKKYDSSDFLQRISRIIGAQNILELDDSMTLEDLSLNEVGYNEINSAIRNAYQISYPKEKLAWMTIAELKELKSNNAQKVSKETGLGTFFTDIDQDECMAAEPLVIMETSNSTCVEEEEIDPKATYVMLVPGFEGHHRVFAALCERLKAPALALQLAPDMPSQTIPQMAAHIAQMTTKRLEVKSKFYLVGYSFGVNVALELARIFEKEGHVGVVYCLNSSPDALRAQLDAFIGNPSDSQLQNAIVEHMYQLMSGHHSAELSQELDSKHRWHDKVELCINKLQGLVNYSHQYKRCLLNSAYQRIMLAREYQPDFKLQSELILIKGTPHENMPELPNDFNLSRYTSQPVQVFDIDSDHASAHEDLRVSNLINRFLEPKLLEEFKTKNLCKTYFADALKMV